MLLHFYRNHDLYIFGVSAPQNDTLLREAYKAGEVLETRKSIKWIRNTASDHTKAKGQFGECQKECKIHKIFTVRLHDIGFNGFIKLQTLNKKPQKAMCKYQTNIIWRRSFQISNIVHAHAKRLYCIEISHVSIFMYIVYIFICGVNRVAWCAH